MAITVSAIRKARPGGASTSGGWQGAGPTQFGGGVMDRIAPRPAGGYQVRGGFAGPTAPSAGGLRTPTGSVGQFPNAPSPAATGPAAMMGVNPAAIVAAARAGAGSTAMGPSTSSAPPPAPAGFLPGEGSSTGTSIPSMPGGIDLSGGTAGGRRHKGSDRGTHDTQEGGPFGLSPEDYYTGPTWEELIGMGKNPGGKGFLKRLRKNAPGWLQDQGSFEQMMGTINEILGSKGAVSPAVLQRGQADVETGRNQGQGAIAARAAAMGLTPDDPRVMAIQAAADRSANRLGSERLRDYEILGEERKRSDLQVMNPIMQFLLQSMNPKSSGNIQGGAPGGGGGKTDYAGAAANLLGQLANAYGNYKAAG